MSNSDFIFLCLCLGIVNALPEDTVPKLVWEEMSEIIHAFEIELSGYTYQIEDTLKRMKC
jgi:hypothetical protein